MAVVAMAGALVGVAKGEVVMEVVKVPERLHRQ